MPFRPLRPGRFVEIIELFLGGLILGRCDEASRGVPLSTAGIYSPESPAVSGATECYACETVLAEARNCSGSRFIADSSFLVFCPPFRANTESEAFNQLSPLVPEARAKRFRKASGGL